MKIILAGGGTGGHVQPIIAILDEFKRIEKNGVIKDLDFLWIGAKKDYNKNLISKYNLNFKKVLAGKFRRYFSFLNIIDFFKIPIGIIQSLFIISKFKPDIIFGNGGYVSVPVCIAGWILKTSIIIHESDSIPGLSNRILARFATKIAVSFEYTKKFFDAKKTVLTGNPIRKNILEGSKKRGYEFFKLDQNKPIIFVTGGSQGARAINKVVIEALPKLLEKYQVIHQCGLKQYSVLSTQYSVLRGYKLYGVLEEEMADAYSISDLIIARAGANTIFEIAACGKASILVPLKGAAQDHQKKNAYIFKEKGASVVIEQENFNESVLLNQIKNVFRNLDNMRSNALKIARPDAVERVVLEIINLANNKLILSE